MVNTPTKQARKYVLAFAAGAVIMTGVAGVSGFAVTQNARAGDPAPTYLAADAVQPAMDHAQQTFPLPLPAGVDWPAAAPPSMTAEGVNVDPDLPRATVSFYWLCAWEDTYLNALHSTNPSTAAAALQIAERFRTLPFFLQDYEDPNNLWYRNVIEAAQNGDTSGVEADLAQCNYFYESQPTG